MAAVRQSLGHVRISRSPEALLLSVTWPCFSPQSPLERRGDSLQLTQGLGQGEETPGARGEGESHSVEVPTQLRALPAGQPRSAGRCRLRWLHSRWHRPLGWKSFPGGRGWGAMPAFPLRAPEPRGHEEADIPQRLGLRGIQGEFRGRFSWEPPGSCPGDGLPAFPSSVGPPAGTRATCCAGSPVATL